MRLILLLGGLLLLAACASPSPTTPLAAQQQAQSAWQSDWRGTWELVWEQAPLAGPILFEAWHADGGRMVRFEILDSPAPQLVGQTYLRNGDAAILYNRLEPSSPIAAPANILPFVPLTDAFRRVDDLLAHPPQSAMVEDVAPSVRKLTLIYPGDQTLILWLDVRRRLVVRLTLRAPHTNFSLAARAIEPLPAGQRSIFDY